MICLCILSERINLNSTEDILSKLAYSFQQENPTHIRAQQFLSLRALGAPAAVLTLALQGVFRGFKDTRTPVLCLGKCLV